MAEISQVILDGSSLINLTGDTVTPEVVKAGYTFHAANGSHLVGSMPGEENLSFEDTISLLFDNGGTARNYLMPYITLVNEGYIDNNIQNIPLFPYGKWVSFTPSFIRNCSNFGIDPRYFFYNLSGSFNIETQAWMFHIGNNINNYYGLFDFINYSASIYNKTYYCGSPWFKTWCQKNINFSNTEIIDFGGRKSSFLMDYVFNLSGNLLKIKKMSHAFEGIDITQSDLNKFEKYGNYDLYLKLNDEYDYSYMFGGHRGSFTANNVYIDISEGGNIDHILCKNATSGSQIHNLIINANNHILPPIIYDVAIVPNTCYVYDRGFRNESSNNNAWVSLIDYSSPINITLSLNIYGDNIQKGYNYFLTTGHFNNIFIRSNNSDFSNFIVTSWVNNDSSLQYGSVNIYGNDLNLSNFITRALPIIVKNTNNNNLEIIPSLLPINIYYANRSRFVSRFDSSNAANHDMFIDIQGNNINLSNAFSNTCVYMNYGASYTHYGNNIGILIKGDNINFTNTFGTMDGHVVDEVTAYSSIITLDVTNPYFDNTFNLHGTNTARRVIHIPGARKINLAGLFRYSNEIPGIQSPDLNIGEIYIQVQNIYNYITYSTKGYYSSNIINRNDSYPTYWKSVNSICYRCNNFYNNTIVSRGNIYLINFAG